MWIVDAHRGSASRIVWLAVVLALLVFHDNAEREFAYGPAQGLPDTKVGTFTQALCAKCPLMSRSEHRPVARISQQIGP